LLIGDERLCEESVSDGLVDVLRCYAGEPNEVAEPTRDRE
jgi:hypothetical protein